MASEYSPRVFASQPIRTRTPKLFLYGLPFLRRFPNYIATERYRNNVAISFGRDIVCLPNDFATNFMKYSNVEKEQF